MRSHSSAVARHARALAAAVFTIGAATPAVGKAQCSYQQTYVTTSSGSIPATIVTYAPSGAALQTEYTVTNAGEVIRGATVDNSTGGSRTDVNYYASLYDSPVTVNMTTSSGNNFSATTTRGMNYSHRYIAAFDDGTTLDSHSYTGDSYTSTYQQNHIHEGNATGSVDYARGKCGY